jgi:hypothetical protein
METIQLEAIPTALYWENPPVDFSTDGKAALTITAGEKTNMFNNPQGDEIVTKSPRLLFEPQGNFTLSARVKVDFQGMFDAGALVLYADEEHWIKLAFESSPEEPTVVSVVTRGRSDDCNSAVIAGDEVYLRLARVGAAFALHYSLDGAYWHFVRLLNMSALDKYAVGFSAQSPVGTGCTASFSEIEYTNRLLEDLRSGE